MQFTGKELRRRREAAGLSRPDVVEMFIRADRRINAATLSRWEDGTHQPKAVDLGMLAQFLECSVEDLFDSEAA